MTTLVLTPAQVKAVGKIKNPTGNTVLEQDETGNHLTIMWAQDGTLNRLRVDESGEATEL